MNIYWHQWHYCCDCWIFRHYYFFDSSERPASSAPSLEPCAYSMDSAYGMLGFLSRCQNVFDGDPSWAAPLDRECSPSCADYSYGIETFWRTAGLPPARRSHYFQTAFQKLTQLTNCRSVMSSARISDSLSISRTDYNIVDRTSNIGTCHILFCSLEDTWSQLDTWL